MPTFNIKAVLCALLALIIAVGAFKTGSAIADFIEHYQSLGRENSTLSKENSKLGTALDLSQEDNTRLVGENDRLKGIESAYQKKESALNQQINKERGESRDEINRLEGEIRKAGVTDAAVPDNVIRMQRERAKAVNNKARGVDDKLSQQTASGSS